MYLVTDPMDYTGGNFSVSFETAAGDTQCIDITLISDNEREPLENFFVDVDLNDMGAIRAGNPSRTRVGIEGMDLELGERNLLTNLISETNWQK